MPKASFAPRAPKRKGGMEEEKEEEEDFFFGAAWNLVGSSSSFLLLFYCTISTGRVVEEKEGYFWPWLKNTTTWNLPQNYSRKREKF